MFAPAWSISPLWWFSIALGVGTLLVAIGWRGRRIGDEPRCRRCGYNLLKLPSPICPECGVDSSRRKPRRGIRRVRPIVLTAGIAALLASIAPATTIIRTLDWRDYAPTWALLMALDRGDLSAEKQIAARFDAGRFPRESTIRDMATRALAVQQAEPRGTPRMMAWLMLLSRLDTHNLLTDAEWERMRTQSIRNMTLKVRDRCREGEPLPLELIIERASPYHIHHYWELDFADEAQRGKPGSTRLDFLGMGNQKPSPRGLGGNTEHYALTLPHVMTVGTHRFSMQLTGRYSAAVLRANSTFGANISDLPSQRSENRRPWLTSSLPVDDVNAERIAEAQRAAVERMRAGRKEKHTFTVDCQIVPTMSDEDCVPLRGDEIREQVRAALRLSSGPSTTRTTLGFFSAKRFNVPSIRLTKPLPFAIAYRAFLKQESGEKAVGYVHFPAGLEHGEVSLEDGRFRELTNTPIHLILRPAPHLIRNTIDIQYAAEAIELGPITLEPLQ